MLRPNHPKHTEDAHPDLVQVRRECERETRYADKARSCWLEAQRFANEQARAITRRVIRQQKA